MRGQGDHHRRHLLEEVGPVTVLEAIFRPEVQTKCHPTALVLLKMALVTIPVEVWDILPSKGEVEPLQTCLAEGQGARSRSHFLLWRPPDLHQLAEVAWVRRQLPRIDKACRCQGKCSSCDLAVLLLRRATYS